MSIVKIGREKSKKEGRIFDRRLRLFFLPPLPNPSTLTEQREGQESFSFLLSLRLLVSLRGRYPRIRAFMCTIDIYCKNPIETELHLTRR